MSRTLRPSDGKNVHQTEFETFAAGVTIPVKDCTTDDLAEWVQQLPLTVEIVRMITIPDFVPKEEEVELEEETADYFPEAKNGKDEWRLLTRVHLVLKLFLYQINLGKRSKDDVPIDQLTYLAVITNNRRTVDDIFLLWNIKPLQRVGDIIAASGLRSRDYSLSILRFLMGYGVKCLPKRSVEEDMKIPYVRCRYAVYSNADLHSDMPYLAPDYASSLHSIMDKHQISHICFEQKWKPGDKFKAYETKLHIKRIPGNEKAWLTKHGYLQFTRAMVDHSYRRIEELDEKLTAYAKTEKYVRFNMYLARLSQWDPSSMAQTTTSWTKYDEWDEKDAVEFTTWANIPKGKERPAWWAGAVAAGVGITKWQIFNKKRGRDETGAGFDDITFQTPLTPSEIPENAKQAIKLLQEGRPKDFIQLASTRTLSQHLLGFIKVRGSNRSFEQMNPTIVDHSIAMYLSVIGWSDLKQLLPKASKSSDIAPEVQLFVNKPTDDFSLPIQLIHYKFYEALEVLVNICARFKYDLWTHMEGDVTMMNYILYANLKFTPELQRLFEKFNLQIYLPSFWSSWTKEKADEVQKYTLYNNPYIVWSARYVVGSPIARCMSLEDALEFQQYCVDQRIQIIRYEPPTVSIRPYSKLVVLRKSAQYLFFTSDTTELEIFKALLGTTNYTALLELGTTTPLPDTYNTNNLDLYDAVYPNWDATTHLEQPPAMNQHEGKLVVIKDRIARRQRFEVPIDVPIYYMNANLTVLEKQWALANRQIVFEPIQTHGWVIYKGIPIMPEYITLGPQEMKTIIKQIDTLPNNLETTTFAARFFPSIRVVLETKYAEFFRQYLKAENIVPPTKEVIFDWRPIAYGVRAERFRLSEEYVTGLNAEPILSSGWYDNRSLMDFRDGGELFADVTVRILLARSGRITPKQEIDKDLLAAILFHILNSPSVTKYTVNLLIEYLKRQFFPISKIQYVALRKVKVTQPFLHFMARLPEICQHNKVPFKILARKLENRLSDKYSTYWIEERQLPMVDYHMWQFLAKRVEMPTTPRSVDERWEPKYMYTPEFGIGQALINKLKEMYVLPYTSPSFTTTKEGMEIVKDRKEYIRQHSVRLREMRARLARSESKRLAAPPIGADESESDNSESEEEDQRARVRHDAVDSDEELIAGVASTSIAPAKHKERTTCNAGSELRVRSTSKPADETDGDVAMGERTGGSTEASIGTKTKQSVHKEGVGRLILRTIPRRSKSRKGSIDL